jgi:hypothetical protein
VWVMPGGREACPGVTLGDFAGDLIDLLRAARFDRFVCCFILFILLFK